MIVAISGMQYSTASSRMNPIKHNMFFKNKSGNLKQSITNNLKKRLNIADQDINILKSLGDDVPKIQYDMGPAENVFELFEGSLKSNGTKWDNQNDVLGILSEEYDLPALTDATSSFASVMQLRQTTMEKKRQINSIVVRYKKGLDDAQTLSDELDSQVEQTEKTLMELKMKKECLDELCDSYYTQMNELTEGVDIQMVNGISTVVPQGDSSSGIANFLGLSGKLKTLASKIQHNKVMDKLSQAIVLKAGGSKNDKVNLDNTFLGSTNTFSSTEKLHKQLKTGGFKVEDINKTKNIKPIPETVIPENIEEEDEKDKNKIFDNKIILLNNQSDYSKKVTNKFTALKDKKDKNAKTNDKSTKGKTQTSTNESVKKKTGNSKGTGKTIFDGDD